MTLVMADEDVLQIYFGQDVASVLKVLTAPDGLFELAKDGTYRLRKGDYVLNACDHTLRGLLLSKGDEDMQRLAEQVPDLGIRVQSVLMKPYFEGKTAEIDAVREVIGYLFMEKVPHFITVMDELSRETVVSGHNPETGAEYSHPNVAQPLTRLLE